MNVGIGAMKRKKKLVNTDVDNLFHPLLTTQFYAVAYKAYIGVFQILLLPS